MVAIQAYPLSKEMIGQSIQVMKNALMPDFSVMCNSNDYFRNADPSGRPDGFFSESSKMLFPDNQMLKCGVAVKSQAPFRQVTLDYHMDYMVTQKETNDLRCYCAAIGCAMGKLSLQDTLNTIQEYFRRNFKYNRTGRLSDYSSIELVRTGGGVCQAIAVLAATILQYTDHPGLIITGEGYNKEGWGPHKWNAVRTPSGRWEFVDFTFGLNRPRSVPSTLSPVDKDLFERTHRYGKKAFSQKALEDAWRFARIINNAVVSLEINTDTFYINGVRYRIKNGTPLLGKAGDGRFWINLMEIINLLGGALEITQDDQLHVCMPNGRKRDCVANASHYVMNGSMFNILILKQLNIQYRITGSMLEVTFK